MGRKVVKMEYGKTSIEFEYKCTSQHLDSCDFYESDGEGGCKYCKMQISGNYCYSDEAIGEELFKIKENV